MQETVYIERISPDCAKTIVESVVDGYAKLRLLRSLKKWERIARHHLRNGYLVGASSAIGECDCIRCALYHGDCTSDAEDKKSAESDR